MRSLPFIAAIALLVPTSAVGKDTKCPDASGNSQEAVAHWRQTRDVECLRHSIFAEPEVSAHVAKKVIETPGGYEAVYAVADASGFTPGARNLRFQAASKALGSATADEVSQARRALYRNVTESGDAIGSAALLAREKAKSGDNPSALCGELVEMKRAGQALACIEGGGTAVDEATRFAVLRTQPSLTVDNIEALVPAGSSLVVAVHRCAAAPLEVSWSGSDPEVPGVTIPPASSKIFSLLADNATAPRARCFLTLSAAGCVADILNGRECDSLDSVARYAATLYRTSPQREADAFVGSLFTAKNSVYQRIDTMPRARLALFQLHLVLAHIYRTRSTPDPLGHDWSWHLHRAESFWAQLHQGQPLPKELAP